SANTTYHFAIKTKDDANLWSGLSNSPSATTIPAPTFTIAHSGGMSSFMLSAGANITETFNITSVNNFEGDINLHFGGPPELEDYTTISPSQVTLTANATQTVTLNLGTAPTAPSGTFDCGLGGQTSEYGGQQRGFVFRVTIGVPGEPMLSASPSVVAVGGQTTFYASQFPESSNITLQWDSGPNAGDIITENQTAGGGTWNVQVTIPEMSGGNFFVKAISGQASAVCQITVTTGSDPDFLMSASPQFISLTPGQSANITIYVASINGFNAAVALSAGTAPGVTMSLSTGSVTPASGETASAILTITVAEWAASEMYQMNVDGSCADPYINKVTNINLDIQPLAEHGPGISLSQSYAQAGDTITITGANFPTTCEGENVTIMEVLTNVDLQTTPAAIAISNGSFTGTFTIPSGIFSGNYRIKAIVASTGDFAERDFQIMGTGETFSLGVSPESTTVATEEGYNSSSVSVNIYSMGGSSTVNLALEGAPNWLTYQFGSLADNTAATGDNAISVPAGGSASRNLNLTASMTAPPGNYSITVKAWITGGAEQRVSLDLTVQPPSGFNMTQFTLSPTFGQVDQVVTFSGSDFTGCTPSQVTELRFGPRDLLTDQSISTIYVPTTGDSAGRFSGTFRVPSTLGPGTYFVDIRVGWPSDGATPTDKFSNQSFTITGGGDTFVIQASPSSLWVEQGNQVSTMIRVQAVGSISPTVMLSVEGRPSGITASFASDNVTAPPGGIASTNLNLNISEMMPSGHYSFTIKGQRAGEAEVNRIPIEIYIAPPEGYEMASIYLNPTVGSAGTWITISGSGFPANTAVTQLYFGPPNPEFNQIANGTLPAINTDNNGAFSAVFQVPAGLTPGTYPIEAVAGTYPDDRMASADFTFISDQATFNINVSPMMIQTAPGDPVGTTVNVQSFGGSS
ncbi:MAG: IPT/TIG domain-containing protein, partial [Dehalococcoidales bacterium]|nr:IPT/TIG domain-containing protein [Dehalococcoidales bacterium]